MRKEVRLRGIRGAVQVEENNKNEILNKTTELLQEIIFANNLEKQDVVAVFFTVTGEINKEFPAYALRQMGLNYVPALCAKEIDVPGAMERVIRVLVLAYTDLKPEEIRHQYLGQTKILRPDLSGEQK
ncbi:MAG: chorismate mutase [Candidatus Aminicenantes bacterium]|nr:chorismate mutase [Candidatus Aminicenantes bacterium]